jgi:hypothetical protein
MTMGIADEGRMVFMVIEGGRATTAVADLGYAGTGRVDVEQEAARRLNAIGYDRWERREQTTGVPVPREIKYLALQIGFAAEAIAGLRKIPSDFRSDIYWPAPMEQPAFRTGP